jgi:signal transduction histidine kinase
MTWSRLAPVKKLWHCAAEEFAQERAAMADEPDKKNHELEAFTYSVSHDLRAPLRTVREFTRAILDEFGTQLPAAAKDYLGRVMSGVWRMSKLIEALLELSRSGTRLATGGAGPSSTECDQQRPSTPWTITHP